jgi:hypothetical protein
MTFTKNIGMLLLAILFDSRWLDCRGRIQLRFIPGLIALLAGIFIILGR